VRRGSLRHNGQNRLLVGAIRALAATITALRAERAERDNLERAVNELFADVSATSISSQPVRFLPALLRAARRRAAR
jgi:hypothetical protein